LLKILATERETAILLVEYTIRPMQVSLHFANHMVVLYITDSNINDLHLQQPAAEEPAVVGAPVSYELAASASPPSARW